VVLVATHMLIFAASSALVTLGSKGHSFGGRRPRCLSPMGLLQLQRRAQRQHCSRRHSKFIWSLLPMHSRIPYIISGVVTPENILFV
jgi:hypothetical protein